MRNKANKQLPELYLVPFLILFAVKIAKMQPKIAVKLYLSSKFFVY